VVHLDFDELPSSNTTGDYSFTLESELENTVDASIPEFSTDTPSGDENDYSIFFNGEGSRIVVPDPDGLLQMDISQDFTLQAYVKFEETPGARAMIISYGLPGGYSISITEDRQLFATTYGIKDFNEAVDAIIPDGWNHVAVVHDFIEAEMRFYINGELMNAVFYEAGVNFTEFQRLHIGIEAIGDGLGAINPYEGFIDRLRFHDTVVASEDFDIIEVVNVTDWTLY